MNKANTLILAAALCWSSLAVAQQSNHPTGHSEPHQTPAHGGASLATKAPMSTDLKDVVPFDVGSRNVKALHIDGTVTWVGTSGGVMRYDTLTGSYKLFDNRSGLLSNGVFYLGALDGRLWVGTYGGGLSVFDADHETWTNYNIPNGMGDAFVYGAMKTKSGDAWIATWSGANRIIGGRLDDIDAWELYTVENTGGGLPNDWVYGLAEGKNGEVWMATEGGLARFVDGKWDHWTHADGIGAPYDLVKDDETFRNDPGKASSHHARQKQEQGLEDVKTAYNPNYIVAITVDGDGIVWVGTWGGGLSRFDGEHWETYTVQDGLPGNHVFALQADRETNRLWIGTNRGLATYDGNQFTVLDRRDGLQSDTIFSIAIGEGGSAWVGGFGGVTWFPNGFDGVLERHAASVPAQ